MYLSLDELHKSIQAPLNSYLAILQLPTHLEPSFQILGMDRSIQSISTPVRERDCFLVSVHNIDTRRWTEGLVQVSILSETIMGPHASSSTIRSFSGAILASTEMRAGLTAFLPPYCDH